MNYEITISCKHGRAGTHKIMESDFEHSADGIHEAIISVWLECPICCKNDMSQEEWGEMKENIKDYFVE